MKHWLDLLDLGAKGLTVTHSSYSLLLTVESLSLEVRIEKVNNVAGNRQRRAVANRHYSVPASPIFKGVFLAIRDCQHLIQRGTYPDTGK
jgi:hypothetical protein